MSSEIKIAFCQCTFRRDWECTIKHIENWLPYVDYVIIIVDETVSREEIEKVKERFNSLKLIIKQVKFNDNIPEFRNHYVEECKRLGVSWFVISDPDEWINELTRKDIRYLVEWAEANGYTQLGLNCREQFEVVEWLPFDKLDLLKEYPGGYRESNYYKLLINKICCERFRYAGVGKTKSVHETWGCPVHRPRAFYLDKERYYYVHKKSAYDIWRNAARNLFIGGGGDNVGDLNEMWVELRQICREIEITKWQEFEEFVTSGKSLPPKLIDWIKRALTWKATDYGIETRETAKWIIYHHRYLLKDPKIKYGVEHPPKPTREDEVENYVRKCYIQILGRHPDRQGLENYKKLILAGKIKKEDLPGILRSSEEYMQKHRVERIKLSVPVNVDIALTDEIIISALRMSKVWREQIKPALDLGRYLLEHIKDRKKFLEWFYANMYNISVKDVLKALMEVIG